MKDNKYIIGCDPINSDSSSSSGVIILGRGKDSNFYIINPDAKYYNPSELSKYYSAYEQQERKK